MSRILNLVNALHRQTVKMSILRFRKEKILETIKDIVSMEVLLKPPTVEKLTKQNLVPKGYEVIYINQHLRYLDSAQVVSIMCLPISLGGFVNILMLKDPKEASLETYVFPFILAAYILGHSWIIRRTVRVVFKKGDQFKTLFYGFFGPFRKIYVDHSSKVLIAPKKSYDFFHYMDGKRVVVLPEYFFKIHDYWNLLKETPVKPS